MPRPPIHPLLFLALLILPSICLVSAGEAQTHPNSPVFRDYTPPRSSPLVKPFNEGDREWENFALIQEANNGDIIAQHELGLRYFLGEGFPADTTKAAYWIRKAALHRFVPAMFNLGVFEVHGWGVEWNPFNAYRNFLRAAEEEMPDAQYVVGIFLMDNLVVPRNESEAYCLVKAAADSGYEPAFELLTELQKRSTGSGKHSSQEDTIQSRGSSSQHPSSPYGLIFLDFSRDTTSSTNDTVLVEEALRDGGEALNARSGILPTAQPLSMDSSWILSLRSSAEAGSPEALTLLGRCFEHGTYLKKDPVQASVRYLRALRLDSPRAAELLWKLIRENGYFELLKSRVDANDPDAQFVWAGLIGIQFDHQLTDPQALELLKRAASNRNTDALVELGTCYAEGRWIHKDRRKAISYWREAAELGSREARTRMTVASLAAHDSVQQPPGVVDSLRQAMREGSILSQVALGYCYEIGSGVKQNKAEAAKLYRTAAQRGNRAAYTSLKRMYDDIRPNDKEFTIPHE